MKNIFLLVFVFLSLECFAQQPTGQWPFTKLNNTRGTRFNGLDAEVEMYIPRKDTSWIPGRAGAVTLWGRVGVDTSLWGYSGVKWVKLVSIGSSGLTNGYIPKSTNGALSNSIIFENNGGIDISGLVRLINPLAVNYSGDSLLVRNSTNGEIETIPVSDVGKTYNAGDGINLITPGNLFSTDLQTVTTSDSVTTHEIQAKAFYAKDNLASLKSDGGAHLQYVSFHSGAYATIKGTLQPSASSPDGTNWTLPPTSAMLPASVNGVVADATGDIELDAGDIGGISGNLTTGYIPVATGSGSLGNSVMIESGNKIGIGTTPNEQLEITGNFRLPTTTSTAGQIKFGTNRYFHAYGTLNTFLGRNSGNFTMSGGYNTALGSNTLATNTTGHSNVAVGEDALNINTTGTTNTAVGLYTLTYSQTGSSNTALGHQALMNSTASSNIAVGSQALLNNTTGSSNIAVGNSAGGSIANGTRNIFIGHSSGTTVSGISGSVAIGNNATVTQSNSLVIGGSGLDTLNVGIGTTAPSQKAILDLVSASKGVLLPRMSKAQRDAIPIPPQGLEVFVVVSGTDGYKSWYDGSGWQKVSSIADP